jgi:hypothetical protein
MKTIAALCLFAICLSTLAFAQTQAPLHAGEHKALNTFFSSFAETNLLSFTTGTLKDDEMLKFALWHIAFNDTKSFKKKNGSGPLGEIVIPASAIDRLTEQFFGKKIQNHEKQSYLFDVATGEVDVFAQVDAFVAQQDGTVLAKGTVYYTRAGTKLDRQATMAAWKKAGKQVRVQGTFSGIVKEVGTAEKRYVLLEYTTKEKQ